MELAEPQKRILLHTTGLSRSDNQYRNHYAAHEGGDAWNDLLALVASGHLKRGITDGKTFGGLTFFHCTTKGLEEARRLKSKL